MNSTTILEALWEASDRDLMDEVSQRGLCKEKRNFHSATDFKRYLCDLVEVGYQISSEELLEVLREKLNPVKVGAKQGVYSGKEIASEELDFDDLPF